MSSATSHGKKIPEIGTALNLGERVYARSFGFYIGLNVFIVFERNAFEMFCFRKECAKEM